MITFAKNQLRAALTHSASKDIRYYLNGVLLEFTASGDVHIVSTDGYRMFCGLINAAYVKWTDQPQKGPFRIIVPADAIKTASKGKGVVTLSALPDGRYSLGDSLFAPIDGKFPDWRRVIPDTAKEQTVEQYNWAYLVDAQTALCEWYDSSKKFFSPYQFLSYEEIGVMHGDDCTAFCVIMPCRPLDKAEPFKPCAYE